MIVKLRGRLGPSIVAMAAATLMTACSADTRLGPERVAGMPHQAGAVLATRSGVSAHHPVPELGACSVLAAPAGSKLAHHMYARGVQVYHWNGTSWSFDGPLAELYADAAGQGQVGIHYGGPTWESNSGSTVIGAVVVRCTPDANAIPWLLLDAVSTEGPGIFQGVTAIQRVNTTGGNAPSTPGSVIGEEARVPYTAEYLFYRAW